MLKLVLEKAEEPEIKLPTSTGSWKKQESSRKNIYFCSIGYAKVFDCMDHNKLENSERDGNTRPPDLPLEKPIFRTKEAKRGIKLQESGYIIFNGGKTPA